MQLEPSLSKLGQLGTAREIVAKEGIRGLATGFGATAVGYLVQGELAAKVGRQLDTQALSLSPAAKSER